MKISIRQRLVLLVVLRLHLLEVVLGAAVRWRGGHHHSKEDHGHQNDRERPIECHFLAFPVGSLSALRVSVASVTR